MNLKRGRNEILTSTKHLEVVPGCLCGVRSLLLRYPIDAHPLAGCHHSVSGITDHRRRKYFTLGKKEVDFRYA